MFEDFFETEEKYFPEFKDISIDFFKSIRCGILHQAETTNAWRILKKKPIARQVKQNYKCNKICKGIRKILGALY